MKPMWQSLAVFFVAAVAWQYFHSAEVAILAFGFGVGVYVVETLDQKLRGLTHEIRRLRERLDE